MTPDTPRGGQPPQSEERFRLLVDSVSDYAIFMLDPDGRVTSWNEGARRLKQYEAHEIIGRHFSTFYPPEDLDKPARELEEAVRLGRVEDEGWRVRKDGTKFWANVIITALRRPDGRLSGFGKVTRDLTERRQVEERLRESEERFRLMVEGTADCAIFMLDPDGLVSTWNEGARRLKQYEAHEIIGRHFSTFYPPEDLDKPPRELEEAARLGQVEDEGWRVRKDGTRFWANVLITALHDREGRLRGFSKVTRDLTERKRSDDALREALQRERQVAADQQAVAERAQALEAAKSRFLNLAAHEMRGPVTVIRGYVSMLRGGDLGPLSPSAAAALDSLTARAEELRRLVELLLETARIDEERLDRAPSPFDLREVVPDAVTTATRPGGEQRNVRVDTGPEPVWVLGDRGRLATAIAHLIDNAVKFSPPGAPVDVRCSRDSDRAVVAVTDLGIGLSDDDQASLFTRFGRVVAPQTSHIAGLGLGLWYAREIARLHDGDITVSSQLGHGSTFSVIVPVSRVPLGESEGIPTVGRSTTSTVAKRNP